MKHNHLFFFLISFVALFYGMYAAESFTVARTKKRAPKITNEQLCNQFEELMHRFSNILQLIGKIQNKSLSTTRALLEGDKNNSLVKAKKETRKEHAQSIAQLLNQARLFEGQLRSIASLFDL